ncbi:SDR family NAD(P)-dependent oxidoreductase [Rossellomorea sp. AcN35-11]|nr:SDR family NAD(P)-dependent oxidoreductase [Rossellomorea aquimaris]WJV29705.1 SDR family NAD(P)-dependent oxidoreductase [Rossellomorea sp. AcN35-11]
MTKIAFVTGANKGIGYEVVRQLAEEGYDVFLGARNQVLGEKAVDELGLSNVRFIHIDLTDQASIHRAAEKVKGVTGRVDVLVNNAGVALDFGQTPSQVDIEVLRSIYEVNVFGTFQVIQAFLPLLQTAEGRSKIINVTTDMSSQTLLASGAIPPLNILGYNTSKSALNAMTLSFGLEFGSEGPEIFGVTPGFTSTDLNGNAPGGKTTVEGAKIIVSYATSGATYHGKLVNEKGIMPW